VLIWVMNGTAYVDSVLVNSGGTYWQVVGTGDFSGDGKTDLLWENPSNGAVLLWVMNGTTYAGGSILFNPGPTKGDPLVPWRIVAVGDYTGDGKPDLIWQWPPAGDVVLWTMDGTALVSATPLDTGVTNWRIRGPH